MPRYAKVFIKLPEQTLGSLTGDNVLKTQGILNVL